MTEHKITNHGPEALSEQVLHHIRGGGVFVGNPTGLKTSGDVQPEGKVVGKVSKRQNVFGFEDFPPS